LVETYIGGKGKDTPLVETGIGGKGKGLLLVETGIAQYTSTARPFTVQKQ